MDKYHEEQLKKIDKNLGISAEYKKFESGSTLDLSLAGMNTTSQTFETKSKNITKPDIDALLSKYVNDKIWECQFRQEHGGWILYKPRLDKDFPNVHWTAERNMKI